MTTIRVTGTKDRSWNADKTVHVYVDGVKQQGFYWGKSLKKVFQDTKKRLGIRRAKGEFVYGEEN